MVDNINWPSFGAGVATGVAATIAFNRARKYLSELGSDEQKAVVRTAAQDAADKGYLRQLVEMAQVSHLLGHKLRLNDILLEPHFIRPPDLVTLPDEDAEIMRDVFNSVPQIHDYPYLHAPYNIPNIEVDDLGRGDGTLALVGTPGSGRTTALMTIALWSAGFVDFKPPDDAVAQQLREQEQDLTPQEQADRVKKRVALMERARHRFAEARAAKEQTYSETQQQAAASEGTPLGVVDNATSRFRQLAPFYVHLANVLPATGEYGIHIDPAEPLIRGLQAEVGWVTSKRLVGKTYKLLEQGQALVLIDGYDDIPHRDRPAIMAWLKQFITLYKENFIIVAMPPDGYGPLMEVGAMPVFLRPWYDQMQVDGAHQYAAQWSKITEAPIPIDRDDFREVETFYDAVGRAARGMNALDSTLHIFSYYVGQPGNESEQMAAYLRSLLPNADDMLEQLTTMAAMQLDDGYITHRKLVAQALERELASLGIEKTKISPNGASENATAVVEESIETESETLAMPEPELEPVATDDDDLASFYSHLDSGAASTSAIAASEPVPVAVTEKTENAPLSADVPASELSAEDKAVAKQQRQISREQTRLLKQLVEAGVLVQYRGGRYQFRHAFLTAYLGARFVSDADEFTLLNKQANPDWEHAICYLAQMRDIDFLVAQQLSEAPLDVLHDSILKVTKWLRFAGTEVTWRGNLLRYLGNLMVATNQFSLVRERIAAALLGMRDEGALVIFRRAIGHPSADVRKLGCLGVGVLRDENAIEHLTQRILQDRDVDVQIAATLALSAIGTEHALNTLIDTFEVTSVREVQRAVAESLAADRANGYMTLFDSVKAQDMMIRRSAIFGLGRIRTDWSLITLNETFLEDTEFYVRLAAESVFSEIYEASLKGVNAYPDVKELPWLTQWIQEQIEIGILPFDIPADKFFETAFTQKEDAIIRELATKTIGQLGLIDRIADLYAALRDRSDDIRDEAYRGLGEFQQRFGKPLPAPVG
jgi:HEAT repeat protein